MQPEADAVFPGQPANTRHVSLDTPTGTCTLSPPSSRSVFRLHHSAWMNVPRPWTAEEDNQLKHAVADYGEEPGMWKTIAQRVPGRTNKACRKRWLHSLSPNIRKTPWTPEEDALLVKLYATHKPARWSLIAKHIPGRTDDACSKRYREALDPQLKKDEWTDQEDANLLELTAHLGSKWTQVGHAMGRSGLGCRNRWRLLERKQRPRNAPRSSLASGETVRTVSPYVLPPEIHMAASSVPIQLQGLEFHPEAPLTNSSFDDGSNARETNTPIEESNRHPSEMIPVNMGQVSSRSLIHGPPPSTISTSSSLSGALANGSSTAPEAHRTPSPCAWIDSELVSPFHSPSDSNQLPRVTHPNASTSIGLAENLPELTPPSPASSGCSESTLPAPEAPTATSERHSPRPFSSVISPVSPENLAAIPGTRKQQIEEPLSGPPRKRPRLRGPAPTEQETTEYPRLSSHLPANLDRTILPYACGHPLCWPGSTGGGDSRFATASEVAEHRRLGHPGDYGASAGEGSKAFRCALQGCGKGWKNINGIQYHLQISKAHFKAALSQTRAPSDSSTAVNAAHPDTVRARTAPPAKDKDADAQKGKRKEYHCPHDGCTNTYKQRTGLQYHLAHGHPINVAQLDVIPPGLMRKITAETQQSAPATTESVSMTSAKVTPPRSSSTPDTLLPQ